MAPVRARISPIMQFAPEVELMLCGAQTHIDTQTAARMAALLKQELDWGFLLRTALRHRLVPLLHQNLNQLVTQGIAGVRSTPQSIPSDVRRAMAEHLGLTLKWNFFLTSRLLSVLDALQHNNIFAIPYKGPIQANFLYGNLTARQFMDLDVLVAPEDARRAFEVLLSLGFKPPSYWNSDYMATFLDLGRRHECALSDPGTGVTVELHWRTQGLQFSHESHPAHLWSSLQTIQFQGRSIPVFAPDDLLLLLSAHGVRHLWYRLHWLCDVAQLVRTQPLNWEQIINRAKQSGEYRGLLLSLILVEKLLGVPIPGEIKKLAETDVMAHKLAGQLQQELFTEEQEVAAIETHLLQTLNTDAEPIQGAMPVYTTVSLPLANNLIGATLPASLAQRNDGEFKEHLSRLRAALARNSDVPAQRYNSFQFQISERLRDKFRYVWWNWATPGEKEIAFLQLPRALRFISIPARLFRLLLTYGVKLPHFKKDSLPKK